MAGEPSGPAGPKPVPHDNRRAHVRFPVPGARVLLYREGFLAALGLGRNNKGREVCDLSEGGARVQVTERLAPETRVRFRITLEKLPDPIEIGGVVRWCNRKGANYEAGIMFDKDDAGVRQKISQLRQWFASPQYKALYKRG